MKTYGQDILTSQKELKERPFTVPDGYFEAFKTETMRTSIVQVMSPWRKAVPYIAVAASLALLFGVGSGLNESKTYDEFSTEDYILFSDTMIRTRSLANSSNSVFARSLKVNVPIASGYSLK